MRSNFLLLSFLCVFATFASTTVAHAGWFDFLFPSQPEGPSPSETLIAPFADPDAVIDDMETVDNLQNSTPLDKKHRTNGIMIGWVQEVVPSLVSYMAQDYEAQYAEKIKYLSKAGVSDYNAFLEDMDYMKTLKVGRYNIGGVISGYPIVLKEKALNGRYLWLFQVDLMVTYLDAEMSDYSKADEDSNITREYLVTFQVGRVKGVQNEHGVLIETWKVEPKQSEAP